MTDAERALWRQLRQRQIDGMKFRRQQPIGQYILDFVCLDAKLVIEIDGGQHAEQRRYDEARTAWLQGQGYTVLRFWNDEVLTNTPGVLDAIRRILPLEHPPPS